MANLEKILNILPRPKLSLKADLRIKSKLYYFIILKQAKNLFNPFPLRSHVLKDALVPLLIIVMIFSGTSLYAYSSKSITPGHKLYALKRGVENVEQTMSFTGNLKTQTFQKFSERRLEEALNLSEQILKSKPASEKSQRSDNIQKNIEEAVHNIASAVQAADNIKDKKHAAEAKNQIKQHENSESQYLSKIESIASTTENKKIIETIIEARKALNKYHDILNNNDREKEEKENKLDNNLFLNQNIEKSDNGERQKMSSTTDRETIEKDQEIKINSQTNDNTDTEDDSSSRSRTTPD